ncbi:MAG: hypothetical protein LDL38_10530 [Flavobacterium piscis]|nr:hypothetical protein [Flavobacterium piscis]
MKIADTHSATFGCPYTQATASQPKEPSFYISTKDRVNTNELSTFFSIFARL